MFQLLSNKKSPEVCQSSASAHHQWISIIWSKVMCWYLVTVTRIIGQRAVCIFFSVMEKMTNTLSGMTKHFPPPLPFNLTSRNTSDLTSACLPLLLFFISPFYYIKSNREKNDRQKCSKPFISINSECMHELSNANLEGLSYLEKKKCKIWILFLNQHVIFLWGYKAINFRQSHSNCQQSIWILF